MSAAGRSIPRAFWRCSMGALRYRQADHPGPALRKANAGMVAQALDAAARRLLAATAGPDRRQP